MVKLIFKDFLFTNSNIIIKFVSAKSKKIYMNTVGINKLGWINCDAFYNTQGEKEILTLDCKPDTNTKFCII